MLWEGFDEQCLTHSMYQQMRFFCYRYLNYQLHTKSSAGFVGCFCCCCCFNTFTFLILNSWITKLLSAPRPWTGINTLLPGIDCPGFKDGQRLPPLVLVRTPAVGPYTETAEKWMTSTLNKEQERGTTRILPGKTESQVALHFGTSGKRTGL